MTITTLNSVASSTVARWTDPASRPLFKGNLIDSDGCACAQGDVLLNNGFSPEDLRGMAQSKADKETAQLLGISRAHAILLRNVNDRSDGSPENVLTAPELILGDQAHIVLAFWRHMDRMTADQWAAAGAAWGAAWGAARDAARAAARAAAWGAAWGAARDAAWGAARDAARDAAAYACVEIQGARIMRERGIPFCFLPMFGFVDPEAVMPTDNNL